MLYYTVWLRCIFLVYLIFLLTMTQSGRPLQGKSAAELREFFNLENNGKDSVEDSHTVEAEYSVPVE